MISKDQRLLPPRRLGIIATHDRSYQLRISSINARKMSLFLRMVRPEHPSTNSPPCRQTSRCRNYEESRVSTTINGIVNPALVTYIAEYSSPGRSRIIITESASDRDKSRLLQTKTFPKFQDFSNILITIVPVSELGVCRPYRVYKTFLVGPGYSLRGRSLLSSRTPPGTLHR